MKVRIHYYSSDDGQGNIKVSLFEGAIAARTAYETDPDRLLEGSVGYYDLDLATLEVID